MSNSNLIKLYVLVFLFTFLLGFLFMHLVMAHDYERPELQSWFMSLKSRGNQACCDGSDATHLEIDEWQSKDGHYQVKLDGEWIDVPDSAIVDGPNKEGRPLVWTYTSWDMGQARHQVVRCFMPASGF